MAWSPKCGVLVFYDGSVGVLLSQRYGVEYARLRGWLYTYICAVLGEFRVVKEMLKCVRE